MKKVVDTLCRYMSYFLRKLLKTLKMRRILTRVVHRVLLSKAFHPIMDDVTGPRCLTGCRMVVGLGNPGLEATRHSVGMAVLSALAARLGLSHRWHRDKHVCGEVIISEIQNTPVVLLRPKMMMNVNGVSVAKAAAKYAVRPEDIVLVHDELDKPLGKVAVKHGGSARGHNGVRSCVDALQTDVMLRLRVGISRPAGKTPVERHVLGRFSRNEQPALHAVLEQSVDLLISRLSEQNLHSSSSPAGGSNVTQKRRTRERSGSASTEEEEEVAKEAPGLG